MAGEHDRTDRENRSEEYLKFRRMMDGAGREGILRMVEHLTARIEANPGDAEALAARGLAYAELGEHRLAAEDSGRFIALDPGNAGAHLDRARAYSAMEEAPSGDGGLRRRHPAGPRRRRGALQPGACRAELGDLAGAMSDFDVAVTLAPGDADAHYNRG